MLIVRPLDTYQTKTEYFQKKVETSTFHLDVYQNVVVSYTTVTLKEAYQVKTVVDPCEYGWVVKSSIRVQKNWSEHKIAPTSAQDMNDAIDTMQGVLDWLGFVPLFGTAADAINTALSIMQKEYLGAMLNGIGLMGGAIANAVVEPFKLLPSAANNLDALSDAVKAVQTVTGIVGDITTFIADKFEILKAAICGVSDEIGKVTTSSIMPMLSKEMRDKLTGLMATLDSNVDNAMKNIDGQVDDLNAKIKAAEESGALIDDGLAQLYKDVQVGKGHSKDARWIPDALDEQLAMKQVLSNPLEDATTVPLVMGDPRWDAKDGWVKMQRIVTTTDGSAINIHFAYNELTKQFDDFKFTHTSRP